VLERLGLALNFDWNTASTSSGAATPVNTPLNAAGSYAESVSLQRIGIGVKGFYEFVHEGGFVFYGAPSVGVNYFSATFQTSQVTNAVVTNSSSVTNSFNLGASAGLGINYFFSSKFGIYAETGYQLASASAINALVGATTAQTTSNLDMSGIYFTVGLTCVFGAGAHAPEVPMSTMAY
jgi:hypothetical protein